MKKRCCFVSITFLFMLCIGSAAAQTLGPVRNLTSSHTPNVTSKEQRITMEWDHSEGEPNVYYAVFDKNPEHILDYPEVASLSRGWATNATWTAPEDSDDDFYYFHVAAADTGWEISPTTSAGPYRIDVVPPYDVSISAPEIASTRKISLTLTSTNACMLKISESEHDLKRQSRTDPDIITDWEYLMMLEKDGYDILASEEECEQSACNGVRTVTREWELSEGEGEKTVYAGFYDLGMNFTSVSMVVTFVAGDADGDLQISLGDAVFVLQVLAGTAAHPINSDADVNNDGRIGIEEAVYILREILNQ